MKKTFKTVTENNTKINSCKVSSRVPLEAGNGSNCSKCDWKFISRRMAFDGERPFAGVSVHKVPNMDDRSRVRLGKDEVRTSDSVT